METHKKEYIKRIVLDVEAKMLRKKPDRARRTLNAEGELKKREKRKNYAIDRQFSSRARTLVVFEGKERKKMLQI